MEMLYITLGVVGYALIACIFGRWVRNDHIRNTGRSTSTANELGVIWGTFWPATLAIELVIHAFVYSRFVDGWNWFFRNFFAIVDRVYKKFNPEEPETEEVW